MQKILGILQAAEGANPNKNLFGEAAGLVSEAINRIPPGIRQTLLSSTPPGVQLHQVFNAFTGNRGPNPFVAGLGA